MTPFFGRPYLPLEALRDEAFGALLHEDRDVARVFRSSGTTGNDRSIVRFSAAGLASYREDSAHSFYMILRAVTGKEPGEFAGVSLIPPVSEWPDSSLAQMVEWLGDVAPVRYASAVELVSILRANEGRPIWLFATAFHLVDLFDQADGKDLRLPPGSVVIETGGTKGRTRSVTREELYGDIEAILGVPERHIISEYGMCELAAQAYDYVALGETAARRFRFPEWVKTSVVTGPQEVREFGRGALVVEDPRRIDVPWAIRTEDLVELNDDGFRLLGRIPSSPLKGCSLLAESAR